MGEVGPGGTNDIVKVMSVDLMSPVYNPWLVIPHYQFNKTKQHTAPKIAEATEIKYVSTAQSLTVYHFL